MYAVRLVISMDESKNSSLLVWQKLNLFSVEFKE
jgi:hypothetical protein